MQQRIVRERLVWIDIDGGIARASRLIVKE